MIDEIPKINSKRHEQYNNIAKPTQSKIIKLVFRNCSPMDGPITSTSKTSKAPKSFSIAEKADSLNSHPLVQF